MGSSLRLALATIIITGFEDVIFEPLITNGTIKFHSYFVDETLLVIKLENVCQLCNTLNKFDKNLRFTVDRNNNKIIK